MRSIGAKITRLLVASLVVLAWSTALADEAFQHAGELPRLQAKQKGGGVLDLPLQHTDVRAEIVGMVAQVAVTQTYGNPFREPIEAIYVFPLPDNSAVDDFKMIIGQRVIQAEIQKREEARRTYEEARRRGNTAALLEQERPNIFTQSIANIAPGEKIQVITRYVQDLGYDAGLFEFVFPMVVGPRFMPGAPTDVSPRGTGAALDTSTVCDASRISPFVVPAGARSGHDISIQVALDAGLPVQAVEAPNHETFTDRQDDRRVIVRLSEKDAIPNRDFVLRWAVAGQLPQTSLFTYREGAHGYLSLVVQPPRLDVEALVGQRELVFVVDSSGSMSGLPIWLCKEAMRDALKRLRPTDTFNVITFSGGTAQAFDQPRRASQENVADALSFIERMQASGGTMMLNAIDAALKPEVAPGRRRYVFFLTDGLVGNDDQIIAATRHYISELERKGQRGRVFSFGVGSAPNRNLLEGIAQSGKGVAVYASNREDPVRGVVRFFRLIDHPVLEDVSIDWGSLHVSQVHPSPMPDLFLSRPLIVHARYELGGSGRVVVRGYADGRKVEIPLEVKLPAEPHGSSALASLWARAEIHDLLADLAFKQMSGAEAHEAAVKETVTGLGIEHRLVTPYTSFVAVDRSRVVGNGAPATVNQPVEVPEDVDGQMAGAMEGRMGKGVVTGALGPMGTTFGSGTGGGGSASGGTLFGSAIGDAGGFGGLGVRGMGGGAPKAVDVPGSVNPADRSSVRSSSVGISNDAAVVMGSLDKDLIRQVIRRNVGQVRYCYESQLMTNPKLAGKVVVRFVISATGEVTEAKVVETTMKDATFEACLLARVKSWRFPAAKGGGVVVVTYPFTFSAN
jgi:Ca-activated chloride channel family protein